MIPSTIFDKAKNNLSALEFSTRYDSSISIDILSVCCLKNEAVIESNKTLESNSLRVVAFYANSISEATITIIKRFNCQKKYLLKLPPNFEKTTKGISINVYGEITANSCIPSLEIGLSKSKTPTLLANYRCHTITENSLLIYCSGEYEIFNLSDCIENNKTLSVNLTNNTTEVEPISVKALSKNIAKINLNSRLDLKQIARIKSDSPTITSPKETIKHNKEA